jgi:nitroreductase
MTHGFDDTDNDASADLAGLVLALIGSRYSVAPKRLRAPGPDDAQLRQMVEAAACAPDHRGLRPWRLIRIADHQREALADLFEACLHDRADGHAPELTADDVAKSRDKAHRAPTLLLAVLKAAPDDPEVPIIERAVTLGAALMNLLLAAHGLGYGAMLTSGRAVRTARFARAMALADDEQAVCFVSIGTAATGKRQGRGTAADYLGDWSAGPALPPGAAAGA